MHDVGSDSQSRQKSKKSRVEFRKRIDVRRLDWGQVQPEERADGSVRLLDRPSGFAPQADETEKPGKLRRSKTRRSVCCIRNGFRVTQLKLLEIAADRRIRGIG